jgi:hypothetical protein
MAVNDSPAHFSNSPATSYMRDNIVVPTVTLGRTAAALAVEADSRIEDILPTGATVASLATPPSTAA